MEEVEVTMLKKGHISPEDLLKGMSKDAKQTWDDLEKKLSKAMSKLGQALPNADAGDLVPHLSDLLEKSLQKLADTGDPNAVLGAGELLKQAAKNAPPNVKEAADLVSDAYDKVVSHDIAPRILRSLDPSQLSAEEWNKLLNELENLDLKNAGRGPGGGIADVFLTKVFMDPRTRYRIRSYLKDLRTAPHTREVFSGYGKYIDARRTFRATTRTGMPMLVFRKPE
ncbi:MAG: hypothetical protein GXO39_05375, partial [Thermotogae bacterium]|nr:hypothetical protein [Thermotogota bacterium]